ncbi:MAG: YceI family protein [Bacteroidota bacterium]
MKSILMLFAATYSFVVSSQDIQIKYVADPTTSKIEWTGKKLTGEHYGEIKLASGELIFTKQKISGGSFEMDMASINCTDITDVKSNKRLVDHLKSEDFFSVKRYPRSHFAVVSVSCKSDNECNITGDLTIKDKTNSITFLAKLLRENEKIIAKATMTFDRSKYDIKFGSQSFFENLGDKLVYDDVDISISLTLNKENPK